MTKSTPAARAMESRANAIEYGRKTAGAIRCPTCAGTTHVVYSKNSKAPGWARCVSCSWVFRLEDADK